MTSEKQVADAVQKTVETFGAIHVAIPCAGIIIQDQTLTSKTSLDMKLFDRLIQINVFGSVYVAKHAVVAMAKNKPVDGERGVVLFVGSLAADESQRATTGYGASKGAIHGMLLPMARDLGKYQIRVAAVAPGVFYTPMGDTVKRKLPPGIIARTTPMNRMGQSDECAQIVCSMIENSYINGVALRIDGATILPHI